MPIEKVMAYLRLSFKYEMGDLKAAVVACVRNFFPSDLPRCVAMCSASSFALPLGQYSWDFLSLCRTHDLLDAQPAIFFQIVVATTGKIETLLDVKPGSSEHCLCDSAEDRRTALLGFRNTLDFQRNKLWAWLESDLDQAYSDCRLHACAVIRQTTLQTSREITYCYRIQNMTWSGLCAPCQAKSIVSYHEAREKFVEVLPSFFGLPPWRELKEASRPWFVVLLDLKARTH